MKKNEFSAAVYETICKLGRASIMDLEVYHPEMTKQRLSNAAKTLVRAGKTQNVSSNAHVAIYTADMNAIPPRLSARFSEEKQDSIKEQAKQPKPQNNSPVAPGWLISKMDGVYVPTRTQPMRPGAMDHEACMSRRADGHKPYTGEFLTLGVKAK